MSSYDEQDTGEHAPKKSTDLNDLPANTGDESGVRGGATGPIKAKKPACSTGLLTTCKVPDTDVNYCDTLSGCT